MFRGHEEQRDCKGTVREEEKQTEVIVVNQRKWFKR